MSAATQLGARVISAIGQRVMRHVDPRFCFMVDRSIVELKNLQELKKVFGWKNDPVIDRPDVDTFEHVLDVNERRLRDAEVLGTVMRNVVPAIALEIGTANGMATVLMSTNAPQAKIFTVNILPEEIDSGRAGDLTTVAMARDQIGIAYRERGLTNITQIFANTATWEPNIGTIDVAFIDGCHDSEFVFNDTRKVLARMRPGGFVLWHDFNPALSKKYGWIRSVCLGIEKLYWRGLIRGDIFHLRDSWTGVYRVPHA